jgi:hypothetical protein
VYWRQLCFVFANKLLPISIKVRLFLDGVVAADHISCLWRDLDSSTGKQRGVLFFERIINFNQVKKKNKNMADTVRAPKQWLLGNNGTIN